MSQRLMEALAFAPKTAGFESMLARASHYAGEQGHRSVALEHLLFALTEDLEAARLLEDCHVDLTALRTDVAAHLDRLDDRDPQGVTFDPPPHAELVRAVQHAAAVARNRPVGGAVALAAIVSDSQTPAAHLLSMQGFTFEGAVAALQHATGRDRTQAPSEPMALQLSHGSSNANPSIGYELAQPAEVTTQPRTAGKAQELLDHARRRVEAAHPTAQAPMPGVAPPVPPAAPLPQDRTAAAYTQSQPDVVAPQSDWPQQQWPEAPPQAEQARPSDRPPTPHPTSTDHDRPVSSETVRHAARPEFTHNASQPAHLEPTQAPARLSTPAALPPLAHISHPHGPSQREVIWQDAPAALPSQFERPAPPQAWTPGAGGRVAPEPPNSQGQGFYTGAVVPHSPAALHPHQPYPGAGQSGAGQPAARPTQYRQPASGGGPPPSQGGGYPPEFAPQQGVQRHSGPYPHSQPPVGGVAAQPTRGQERAPPRSAQPSGAPAGGASPELLENIPRKQCIGASRTVEIRLRRVDVARLLGAPAQPLGSQPLRLTHAISVRLRSADRAVAIEPDSPETEWIDNRIGGPTEEFSNWRFTLTPRLAGRRRLTVAISARRVGDDGLVSERRLPDHIIEVRVMPDRLGTLQYFGWVLGAGLVGLAIGQFAGPLIRALLSGAARLVGV